MFYKKRQLCIAVVMLMLCGCSQKAASTAALVDSSQQTEQQGEPEEIAEAEDDSGETEEAGEAEDSNGEIVETENVKNSFPKITVIDTLPEVDETVPRELTPLPSSEIINIMGHEEVLQHIRQEDGTFSDEQFNIYNVICHDHDVSFAMPEDGQIIWRGSGVSVQYIGEREREIIRELDEKNVVGDDCREFSESMAKTRQLIREGFLQDEFAKYLSHFPELQLEDKELTLELISAERTDRMEDGTSWWELDYILTVELEDGSRVTLAMMDITRVFLVQGEENTWDDAHYRIWGYPDNMWELLEQPQEDKGETFLTVLPEGTFTDEASIYDYMEEYAKERQITWECSRENDFWYDYLIFKGEGSGYQYQVAVPITDEGVGSWLIQAQIKKGADSPEDCLYAASVFMQTFHGNPYFYCVKKGDTLYGIAKTYLGDGDSYPRLAGINGLADPDFIYEGQLIEIPMKKY